MKASRIFFVAALAAATVAPAVAQVSTGVAEVRTRGDVRRIQPMPDGSFVLGGFTAYFNGTRDTQLIRLQANGARVPFPVEVGGSVSAMAVDGGWLYLGGDFAVVNGVSLPFVARVNATSGAVDATWRPAPNGDITDIAPTAAGVAIAGAFSHVGGLPRSRLAMVSSSGAGRALETWTCDANGQVERLLLSGGNLHAAGRFTRLGNVTISYLARLSPTTGAVDAAWRPNPNFHVFDLSADATHLYCAGSFTTLGGVTAPYLGRATLAGGAVDSGWRPQPDELVTRVVAAGDSVYAAGPFSVVSGAALKVLSRIPKAGGTADATWKPPLDGAVMSMVPDGGNGCWAGGRFGPADASAGAGFARFTNSQGTAPPVYPATVENVGAVKAVRADGTGGWLVGGDFDTVNGAVRHALFRLTAAQALDGAWNAGLGGFFPTVNAMDAIADAGAGAEMMIGGQFEVNTPGAVLYNCLRVKIAGAQVVTTFVPQPSGEVHAIARQGGQWLLGGTFEIVGAQNVGRVASIGLTGTVDPTFAPRPNGAVHAVLPVDGEVFIGGEFTGFEVGAQFQPLPYLARVTLGGPDIGWQPRPNQAVFALASDGTTLFAGGRFSRLARTRRQFLAQLPLGGAGTATAWNPAPDDEVRALRLSGGNLWVGGAFSAIGGRIWPKLARFPLATLALDTTHRSTGENGAVFAIEPVGAAHFIGGSFNGWDDSFAKRSLVTVTGASAAAPPQALSAPPFSEDDVLADWFAPGSGGPQPLPAADGPGLWWQEAPSPPAGMVARVQWSDDCLSWHESGDSGLSIVISAAGAERRATLLVPDRSPPGAVFLRLVVTAGESPSLPLP